jgi:YD repeat-containing protein
MFKYAYSVMSSQGLGISYSSLQQIGELQPTRGIGQADVRAYINLANGNLVIRDYVCRVKERSGFLEFCYLHNLQNGLSKWCLVPGGKYFKQLPDGKSALLVEDDGHETTYTYDAKTGFYFAPALSNGTPYLDVKNNLSIYYPGTQVTENFNSEGYLANRIDREGQVTTFDYAGSPKQLSRVVGALGTFYRLERTPGKVRLLVTLPDQNKPDEPLMEWSLDGDGNLAQTNILNLHTPVESAYTIRYSHAAGQLRELSQSDQSLCLFTYDAKRISAIGVGYATSQVTYSGQVVILLDANKQALTLTLDQAGHIVQVDRELGVDKPNDQNETTQYRYTPLGQLDSIIEANGGVTQYTYGALGLCIQETQPLGQTTAYYYEDNLNPNKL